MNTQKWIIKQPLYLAKAVILQSALFGGLAILVVFWATLDP
jgi:hypothetical protein